jgi:hypothetical protein
MIRSLTREITKKQVPQISIDDMLFEDRLPKASTDYTYAEYREFQKDATVALVREVAPGPILASNWTIESEEGIPEEDVKRIKDDVMRIRNQFLLQAVRGLNDYGWMGFEKVWKKDSEGYAHLHKLKPLLHEHTWILVDDNGSFLGFQQDDQNETVVPLNKALLLSQDVEGTNWYGSARLETVGRQVEDWDDCNDGARRYDQKIAGSHWVVYYPIGETPDANGDMIDNYTIAGNILAALESSGKMRIPSSVQTEIESMNEKGESSWKIETISDNVARQHSFVARLEYLDKLKVRAYGFPEDVILKTRYSPKTEQGVHANIIATAQDVQHQYIIDMLNRHVIDQTLRYNHGKDSVGSIWIVPAPITNMSLSFLQDSYKMLLNNQSAVTEEYNHVDIAELRTKVGIPHDNKVSEIKQIVPTEKTIKDPLEDGSFKAEGVQN